MKKLKIFLFFILISFLANAQNTILNSDFPVSDFIIEQDSIYLIEKRHVKYYKFQDTDTNKYFIGGYGLKIYNDKKNNEIISISNEFEQTVSSLRFYNKSSKNVESVFYYKEGKTISALIVPDLKSLIMSLNNNKIIVVNYSEKPLFKVTHEINLKAFSRTLYFKNNTLYYATDLGKIYAYNFDKKKSTLIFSFKEKITNLTFFNDSLVFTTIEGRIVKFDVKTKISSILEIKNNFILNTFLLENKLICGTFKGSIIIVNLSNMKIDKKIDFHKRSVLKITQGEEDYFYSSSIDKTIKKWKLN